MAKTKEASASRPKGEAQQKRLLKRRLNLPIKGRLGKTVAAPKWLRALGGYFVGSWQELREVSWPTRRATWGLTAAVLLFTVVLVALILGLDFGFEQLFKKVIL